MEQIRKTDFGPRQKCSIGLGHTYTFYIPTERDFLTKKKGKINITLSSINILIFFEFFLRHLNF